MFRILFNRSSTRTGACGMGGDDLGEHARANHHGEHARAALWREPIIREVSFHAKI